MQGFLHCQAAPGEMVPCGPPMIVFDYDGTLVNSMPLCLAELTATFQAMGMPVPPLADLQACNGPSHEEAAVQLGIPAPLQEEFCRIRGVYQRQLMLTHQHVYPGVHRMLEILCACARLYIVSNGGQAYIDRSTRHWGLDKYFAKAMGNRPNRSKGQLVAELIKENPPCRAVMVGDRQGDIAAGKENGLYTVAACYGFGSPQEWRLADRRAATVEEVASICLQWIGR